MQMKTVYLALAIVGAVVPYVFFVQQMQLTGLGLGDFVAAAFANPVAAGFASDLFISSFIFWIVIFRRRSSGKGPKPALFVVLMDTMPGVLGCSDCGVNLAHDRFLSVVKLESENRE